MTYQIVPIAATAELFLIGCGEDSKETASDVAEANKAADNSIAEARTDANNTVTKANEGAADIMQTYTQSDAEAQPKLGTAEGPVGCVHRCSSGGWTAAGWARTI